MYRLAILNRITAYLERRRQQRAYLDTARVVEGLPFHIRKDIGWPDSFQSTRRNTF